MPRPSKRTPEVEETILSRLRQGEPLASICRDNDDLPHPSAWRDWCDADETLAIAYGRAREEGEDAIAAMALEIIDGEPEYYTTETGSRIDPGSVALMKLRHEGRLKLLAKWNPKRWGEKVDLTTGGERITHDATDVATRTAALLARAKERKDEK